MVITKIVEGLIRLFGRSPFDESNHPIDGGIFAAIMDLDCLNGVRGGKAAARRRRKRDSRLLQQNVSVAGSLTTQMMLDRHSQGVERMGYPLLDSESGHGRRGSYIPVNNPIMTPVNEFGGRRSISDQGSMLTLSDENRVTEAWRPMNYYDAQPLTSPSERTTPLSSPRLSQGYFSGNPPSIRVTSSDDPHYRPTHTRAYSASAIMEELRSPNMVPLGGSPPMRSSSTSPGLGPLPTPVYPPTAGARPDRNGARPPPLTIPRRRSLNNISIEEGEPERSNGGKRRSWSSGNWFSKSNSTNQYADDSGSDDEPGPRRRGERRRRVQPHALEEVYDEPASASRGWKALFSRKKAMDQRARNENYVRKAAAVNISGALLAGVDAPTPPAGSSFRVQRKGMPPPRPPRPDSGEVSSTPLLAAPPPSFRVRRKGDPPGRTTPTPTIGTGSSMSHLIREEDEELISTDAPMSHYDMRHKRRSLPTANSNDEVLADGGRSPPSSWMRPVSQSSSTSITPVPTPANASATPGSMSSNGNGNGRPRPASQESLGYSAAMFVPLNDTHAL